MIFFSEKWCERQVERYPAKLLGKSENKNAQLVKNQAFKIVI